jgi:hypothetical protein
VIEVNRKILGIAVFLLAVAMLATPFVGTVMAGKGQEKLSFEIVVEVDTSPLPLTLDLIPKKYVFPDGLSEAQRLKTAWTFADATVTLLIDSVEYAPSDFDFIGFNMANLQLEPNFAISKLTWTFTFGEIGTIVVESTGKIFDLYTPDEHVVYKNTGHGTDQLRGVKIDQQELVGTIMGLDTALLEPYKV